MELFRRDCQRVLAASRLSHSWETKESLSSCLYPLKKKVAVKATEKVRSHSSMEVKPGVSLLIPNTGKSQAVLRHGLGDWKKSVCTISMCLQGVRAREGGERAVCAQRGGDSPVCVPTHNTENTLCWLLNKPASPSSGVCKYIRGAVPQTGQQGQFHPPVCGLEHE